MEGKLREIITRILPDVNAFEITESSRLTEDLRFDSLNLMMLHVELEETFGFKFSKPVNFETVSDVCGYLECRI